MAGHDPGVHDVNDAPGSLVVAIEVAVEGGADLVDPVEVPEQVLAVLFPAAFQKGHGVTGIPLVWAKPALDVQGAQQSGLPDRANAEPGGARPEGQRPSNHLADDSCDQRLQCSYRLNR